MSGGHCHSNFELTQCTGVFPHRLLFLLYQNGNTVNAEGMGGEEAFEIFLNRRVEKVFFTDDEQTYQDGGVSALHLFSVYVT